MNLNPKRGSKVKVTSNTRLNGYASDVAKIKKYLKIQKEYTVEQIVVNHWGTEVILEEHPLQFFNTVNFEDVVREAL